MTDEYEIPTGDTGHEPGTFLMVLTALRPFTLYETTKGWTREQPDPTNGDGQLIEAYNKIEWVFADDEGETGTGRTSTARSERSTLFAWATGLGLAPAVVLDRSRPIPSSQLIGREAMVTFAPNKNGYNEITNVVPPPRQRQAPAPAVAAEVPATALPNQVADAAPNPSPSPSEVPVAAAVDELADLPF